MTTPHVLYSGLDKLEVYLKFEDSSTHNTFLSDISWVFSIKPESKIDYLNRKWIVFTSDKRAYRRYLRESTEGFTVYLDSRGWKEIGSSWPVKIVLGKPDCLQDSIPPLWSNPFETAKNLILSFKGFYGEEVIEKVSRVDLCCHFSNFHPTYPMHSNFVTRLKSGFIPDKKSDDINSIETMSFGKVRNDKNVGSSKNTLFIEIYNINRRLEARPNSFNPFKFYSSEYQQGDIVYNLEFQVWSKVLQEYGIQDLDDLEVKYRSLWALLMTKKLSLRVANKADKTKHRWKVDPRWKVLVDAFDDGKVEPLSKVSREIDRMPIERKKKRTHTEITGYLADVNWHDLTVNERIKRYLAEGGREAFSDEAIEKYRAKKGLKKVLRESSNE